MVVLVVWPFFFEGTGTGGARRPYWKLKLNQGSKYKKNKYTKGRSSQGPRAYLHH
jgi:hypothetical protein